MKTSIQRYILMCFLTAGIFLEPAHEAWADTPYQPLQNYDSQDYEQYYDQYLMWYYYPSYRIPNYYYQKDYPKGNPEPDDRTLVPYRDTDQFYPWEYQLN